MKLAAMLQIKNVLPRRLKVDYSHAADLVSLFLKKFIILNSLNCIKKTLAVYTRYYSYIEFLVNKATIAL